MKALKIFLLLAFCYHVPTFAQDVIYKMDGTEIEAKVVEVSATFIKYKKFSNPDGPTYTLYKTSVIKIIYENGEEEKYNEPRMVPTETETIYYEENESKHFIRRTVMGQDFFQFYYRNISFFFEMIKSPVYAMRLTFYFNFKKEIYRPHFPLQHGFSAYPHFSFYNTDNIHIFMGPHFHHGISRNMVSVFDYEYFDGTKYVAVYSEEKAWNWHNIFLVEPGISINPVKNLDITIHGGPGFVTTFGDLGQIYGDIESSVKFAWKVGITVGGKW